MSTNKDKRLLILDLDNTLWDWCTYFVHGIEAQVNYLYKHTSVHPKVIYAAFSQAHKELGCTEHPDAVFLVTERLNTKLTPLQSRRLAVAARERFIAAALPHLKLYDGVVDVISTLPRQWRVALFTDALEPNATLRIGTTGLYRAMSPHLSAITDESEVTDHKPSPSRLLRIAAEFGVDPVNCVVVGDSRAKDVRGANQAGMISVLASYGEIPPGPYLDRLLSVTSYSTRQLSDLAATDEPRYVISSFSDLRDIIAGLSTVGAHAA